MRGGNMRGLYYLIAVVLLILLVVVGQAIAGSGYGTYPRAGRVSGISRDPDFTACFIIDSDGCYWWLDDPDDFRDLNEGDLVAMIINDAGTKDDRTDDYVIKAVCAGEV